MLAARDDPDRITHQIVAGEIPAAWLMPDGTVLAPDEYRPGGLIPGSFDPLHDGHRRLRDCVMSEISRPVDFELTVRNADKTALEHQTLLRRCRQFVGVPLLITSHATFVEKCALVPGCTFVVGADTAERVLQRSFYDHSEQKMLHALATIRGSGCRFLVACRQINGQLLTRSHLAIPPGFDDVFLELASDQFRYDISSTEIRSGNRAS